MTFSTSDESGIELMKSLRAGRVVFFAGAGISMDSGLPDAMELIAPVACHYFPTRSRKVDEREVVLEPDGAPGAKGRLVFGRDILPEELYSILLEHLPEQDKADCVGMFGCLRPSKGHEYCPQPNFVHRFIVLYSYVHDVPVFTVNFDPMFELACEQQGLPYRAYSFRDMEAYERYCADDDGSRIVRICKVHGSVGLSDDEAFDHRMIKTTAEAISRDDGWAASIIGLMGDHDLAFAGYSGRDVDFYPAIRTAALAEKGARKAEESPGYGYRPLFWFDRFKDECGNEATKANECEACRVGAYPDDALPAFLLADAEIIPCANDDLLAKRGELVEQAHRLLEEGKPPRVKLDGSEVFKERMCSLPSINEDILYLETLVHWQRNLSAKRFLNERGRQLEKATRKDGDACVWLQRQKVRVYREVGNMRSYTLGALRMVRKTPKGDCWSEDSVHARLELISSLQMRIPNFDTSAVGYSWWEIALMAPLALITEAAFCLLRRRVIGRGLLTEDSDVAGISAVGELENRHLALEFRMVDALPFSARRKERLREPLEKRLLALGDSAQKKGLHATVKGVIRRIDKIGFAEDSGCDNAVSANAIRRGLAKDASADDVRRGLAGFYHMYNVFFGVFPDVSQKTNMDRRRGGLDEAIDAYEVSRVCGNTLGDLKSLVTIVSRALDKGGALGLPGDHRRYLDELRELINDRDRCEGLNLLNLAHVKRFLREMDKCCSLEGGSDGGLRGLSESAGEF